MRFLFVACNKNKNLFRNDPSFIYRCENLAYGLEQAGHQCELAHLRTVSLRDKPDVIIVHRPVYSLRLRALVVLAKRRKIRLIMDVDDLIFDPEYASDSPAVRNESATLGQMRKVFAKNQKAMNLFREVTVSTKPLIDHITRLQPGARVVQLPNCVHHTWLPHADQRPEADKEHCLTYFPGTKSHDRDFAGIEEPITRYLLDNPESALHMAGPITFSLPRVPEEKITHRRKVPFEQHWKNYLHSWVNLAPLEKTPFNTCKSAIKVIEAAFWGVPTICADIPDMRRLEGAGALCAESSKEWLQHLQTLSDPEHYAALSRSIRREIMLKANVCRVAQSFLKWLEDETNHAAPGK